MKKCVLWCMTLLTTPLFAAEVETLVADTLTTDSVRNERLEQYLDSDFCPKPETIVLEEAVTPKKRELHVLKISGGGALITSKVRDPFGENHQNVAGLEGLLEFEHIVDHGDGTGRGSFLSVKANHSVVNHDFPLNLYYAGVGRVWSSMPKESDRWRWELGIGAGVSLVSDLTDYREFGFSASSKSTSSIGAGVMLKAGGEYRLNQHFGLGLELNEIYHILFDDTFKDKDALITGFATISLTLGLRFYL